MEGTKVFLNREIKWCIHIDVFIYAKSLRNTSVHHTALRHLQERKKNPRLQWIAGNVSCPSYSSNTNEEHPHLIIVKTQNVQWILM